MQEKTHYLAKIEEGEETERSQAREVLERQEDRKERESGEEDKRVFNSEKRLASKGRRTVRWREGGGEQEPKEAQNPLRSRGKEEEGGREASKEETESDWG